MPRYHVVTLGCKLNQSDSAGAEGLLRAQGFEPTADPAAADLILLNTCTVTAAADRDGRRLARRLRRLNPGARIVAAGCYAERDPVTLRGLGVFDAVVGHAARHRLPAALLGGADPAGTHTDAGPCGVAPDAGAYPEAPALSFEDSARAWLRVQEGCDLACSYCIIPRVRGPARSWPAAAVVADARALAARGVREIGLTGVNVGSWGRDLTPRAELADLIDELLAADLPLVLRLNSLEPRTVTPRIVELLNSTSPSRLAPHLQIPLQSGSDRVLGAMARNYRGADYRRLVESLVERVPDVCLGADLISGFPGESEAEHRETVAFVADLPLAYLHVFSYSPRPGTRAAALPGRLPAETVGARNAELRALGARKRRAYRERFLGRVLPALALGGLAPDGWRRTLTAHYIEVLVPAAPPGTPLTVRLTAVEADGETVRGAVA
ncbi:MAG: MiaB/RimO family radical SAM methylthiotransferase [Acidobacteria bacterium]|nr:MiaB/RimO family radical SAM methylthiotransferase [Acidobacteriota bacterium]